MQRRSQGQLHGFQVQPAGRVPLRENDLEQSVYFSRDLLMNRSSRFFDGPGAALRLYRTKAADPLIDRHQLGGRVAKAMIFVDLGLGFAEGGGGKNGFGHGPASHCAARAELGILARVVGAGAVASGLSAAAGNRTDGTQAKSAPSATFASRTHHLALA
jgi:hypothetical protein